MGVHVVANVSDQYLPYQFSWPAQQDVRVACLKFLWSLELFFFWGGGGGIFWKTIFCRFK